MSNPAAAAYARVATTTASAHIELAAASERYVLTAHQLLDDSMLLNGTALQLGSDDQLPSFKGAATPAGVVDLAPASITFFAIANANNAACR